MTPALRVDATAQRNAGAADTQKGASPTGDARVPRPVARRRASVTSATVRATLLATMRARPTATTSSAPAFPTGVAALSAAPIRQASASDGRATRPFEGRQISLQRPRATSIAAPADRREAATVAVHNGVSQEPLKELGTGKAAVRHAGRAPAATFREATTPLLVEGAASEAGPPLRGIGATVDVRQTTDDATDDGVPSRTRTRLARPETIPYACSASRAAWTLWLVPQTGAALPLARRPVHVEAGQVRRRLGASRATILTRPTGPFAVLGGPTERLVPGPQVPTSGHVPTTAEASSCIDFKSFA